MNYAHTFRHKEYQKEYLLKALELVSVAEPMTEKKYQETGNERVQSSLSHIRYTKATIQSEICEVNDYSDVDMVERTIDAIDITLKSPYNSEEYKREMKRRAGIIIHKVVSDGAKLGVSRLHQKKLESMMAY